MMTRFAASAFMVVTSLAMAALGTGMTAAEAPFPTKPVKFLIPYPAGGSNDVLARIVADKLQARWGQPIIIENVTGGSGNIAASLAAQADPDGYTLLVSATPPLATNQSLYRQLTYKAEEFVPITLFGSVPNLVIVRKGLPVNSVDELIAHARAHPGQLVYGSQGVGNTPHLTANMFMNLTGTSMVHVPYRGETLVYNDMLGERVDVFFGNISGALALYRDAKLKVLAVTDTARASAMPEVPSVTEIGLPGLVSGAWYAMVGPPRLSRELQQQLGTATIAVLKMPDVQQRFRALNIEPDGRTPAETATFIKAEVKRWGELIRANNIVLE
ncbi:MAG: Bug family tripartite tricarboxylate transporter substrate binding protein [Xanthobacteraceae bacterium]